MRWLKTFAVLLLAVVAISLWANGSGEDVESKKEVTVWLKKTFNPEANELIQARVLEYGELNNLDIEIEVIPTNVMVQKFNTAVEAGTLPDVTFLTAAMISSFSEKGLLMDLNGLIDDISKTNGPFVDATVRSVTLEGATYGIPQWTGGEALYYRKDFFEKAGINAPPETWAELEDYAQRLTGIEDGVYGAGFTFGPGGDCYNHGSSLIYSYGGSILKPDGRTSNFDSPETVEALSVWTRMLADGSMPPSVVNWDDGGNNKAYLSGQVAMVVNSGSIMNALYKPENKELLDLTGVYYIPEGPAGRIIKGTGNFMSIFNESNEPEIGKEIIKYVMNYDWYRDWMVRIAPVSQPVYQKARADEIFTEDPIHKIFLEMAQMQQNFGYPGEPTGAHGEFQNLRIMSKTLQRSVIDKVSLEQAVSETEEYMNDHLETMYGGK
jgi:multiple sugar transport system substrate-binding protein